MFFQHLLCVRMCVYVHVFERETGETGTAKVHQLPNSTLGRELGHIHHMVTTHAHTNTLKSMHTHAQHTTLQDDNGSNNI